MAGGILREGGVPEKEMEETWRAWRRERKTEEAERGKNVTDGSDGGWRREKCTRRRRKRGREGERGNVGRMRAWTGRERAKSRRTSPFSWKEQGPRRRGGKIGDDDGGGGGREAGAAAGVGFVRPRQWGRGQSPRRYHLSVASRFPDTADRHRQVSESNSRSFTSQPTRIGLSIPLDPFSHTLLLLLSPSGTSPLYDRYTPQFYSCFTCRFCCRRPRLFLNF